MQRLERGAQRGGQLHRTARAAIHVDVDEVSLALVADMWSRTYRSSAKTFTADGGPQRTRAGLRIIPDEMGLPARTSHLVLTIDDAPPASVFETTLRAISARYGPRTADAVAMQLEYVSR